MRPLVLLSLMLSLVMPPALAGQQEDVGKLLQDKIEAVMLLVQDKTLDKTGRNERILALIEPLFSYPTMAKLSLGKKHWPRLSSAQQDEFSGLFVTRLQQSYLDKLDIYTDERILYGEPLMAGKQMHLPTTLVSKTGEVEILYKFFQSGDNWKIYDVEVGGVSVIQTYRSQFDGILKDGSVEDLLQKLRTDGAFSLPDTKPSQS